MIFTNNIFQRYLDLKMISITDHNQISVDIYQTFKKLNHTLKVILRVEVDTYLYKHEYK